MVDTYSALGDSLVTDSRVFPETVALNMVARRWWEGDYFKECWKNVSLRIGLGEINVDGHYLIFFSFSILTDSSRISHIPRG